MNVAEGWGCGSCGGSNPDGTRYCGWCGLRQSTDVADVVDERRLITALFADISGFTTLADRLDEESLHAVIEPVIAGLAAIAERYEGYVAKYAGDALLVFFGAPVAHEDDAARALHVALEMHRALPGLIEQLPDDAAGLELHIGVNSGRVIAGQFGGDLRSDYSILGDAVNVAQRLESVAPAGETYVGESTYQLASSLFELEALGELTVKGKPEPVAAWRLVGVADATGPRIDVGSLGSGFIGRSAELIAVSAVMGRLREGRGGTVVVTGEPGVGKSRFTDEVRRRLDTDGVWWLEGRCVSYGSSLAYWPYVDLLRRVFGIRIEDDPVMSGKAVAASAALAGCADVIPYFTRLLGVPCPPGRDALDDLEPEAFRRGLHRAFDRWLRALAAMHPIALVIEDLHWSDRTSLALTAQLARLGSELPVVVYVTRRPPAAGGMDDDAADLIVPDAVTLRLEPFDPADTEAMVEQMLDDAPPIDLLEAVRERTAGNPFFVREMVRSLVETGALVREPDGWHTQGAWDAAAIPATIEGVLSARIDLLPRSTSEVLQVASVIGRLVDTELLRFVAEDVPDLAGAIDRLVASGFLDRSTADGHDVLTFHHALVLDVAYGRLLRRQRRDLHRKVAEAAEVIYGAGDDVIDLLAREYYLAEAGAKAVDYLCRAAARAKRLFANEEAIVHFSRGVELARATPRVASRLPSLLLDLADLEDLTGDYDDAFVIYGEVRERVGDPRAWRGMAAALRKRGRFEEALALLDDAFANQALQDADLTPLWVERAWTLVAEGRFLEAREAAQAGLAATVTVDDPFAGQLLLQLTRAEEALGRLEEAEAHAGDAAGVFERLGDVRHEAVALRYLGGVLTGLDRLDDATAALQRGIELAERTGAVEEVAGCLVNLGNVEQHRGNLAAAIECDRSALVEFERTGHAQGQALVLINLAEKLRDSGELDEAAECCDRGVAIAGPAGSQWLLAEFHRMLATIRLGQSMPAEAASRAEEAASLFLAINDTVNARESLEVAATACDALGDAERARSTSERARALVA